MVGILIEEKKYFQSNQTSFLNDVCYSKDMAQCLSCLQQLSAMCTNKGKDGHTNSTDSCEVCRVSLTADHSVCEIGISYVKHIPCYIISISIKIIKCLQY